MSLPASKSPLLQDLGEKLQRILNADDQNTLESCKAALLQARKAKEPLSFAEQKASAAGNHSLADQLKTKKLQISGLETRLENLMKIPKTRRSLSSVTRVLLDQGAFSIAWSVLASMNMRLIRATLCSSISMLMMFSLLLFLLLLFAWLCGNLYSCFDNMTQRGQDLILRIRSYSAPSCSTLLPPLLCLKLSEIANFLIADPKLILLFPVSLVLLAKLLAAEARKAARPKPLPSPLNPSRLNPTPLSPLPFPLFPLPSPVTAGWPAQRSCFK